MAFASTRDRASSRKREPPDARRSANYRCEAAGSWSGDRDLQPALEAAKTKSEQLEHSSEVAHSLRNLIDRIQLESGGIRVSLNL